MNVIAVPNRAGRTVHRGLMLALGLWLVGVGGLDAQDRGVVPEDYYRTTFVGDVSLSPSGDLLAFTVTSVVEEENRRQREVWMQRVRAGEPDGPPFRFTDPTREAWDPRWSPDGRIVGFQSVRNQRSGPWFVNVAEARGEAYQIPGVHGAPLWSPDGQWIAFTWSGRDEGTGDREGWIAPDAVTNTLSSDRFDGRVITHMRYKQDGVLSFLPHPSARPAPQLHIVPAQGGEPRQITDTGFRLRDLTWAPDGTFLVFSGDDREDEDKVEANVAIYSVTRDSGAVRRLTSGSASASHTSPAISPDGQRLAFLLRPEPGAPVDLMVVDLGPDGQFRGGVRNLTSDWPLSPGAPEWKRDGEAIRFSAGIGGAVHVFEVPLGGGPVRQVTSGERQVHSVSYSGDQTLMAYTATDAETPAEVFVSRSDGGAEHRVTTFNDRWLSEVTRVPAERVTWRVSDGTEIEGWVVKPVGYEPGRRYPMILKIHGGPHGAYGNTFFQAFHVLSASGFFVLYPNPRGSSSYGNEFEYATRGEWGEMDMEDFLTGVDAVLERYPDIDPARLGVSGGSYGGFSTNWLTGNTDRFAAAVTSRSITNWETWWGTSDIPSMTEFEFYGAPWEQRERYRRLSPFSYVENVTAPTLIIHSEQDWRTPIADAEMWFMALKKRDIPVEFVRYPRSSHGLSRTGEPWLLVDRLERIRTWFAHWLAEGGPAAATDGG